jgi:hypothetical protein
MTSLLGGLWRAPGRDDGGVPSLLARLLVAAALAIVALGAVSGSLSGPPRWSPDGLFYQARVYELRENMTRPDALRRAFGGPLGADLRAVDPERSGSSMWVAYNARFYERRIVVPYLASLVAPVSGDRALLDVSLAGYVAAVLAVFVLLLVAGFRLGVAAAVAAATAFVPALTKHADLPLTDTWGLALEAFAFTLALIALKRRDMRWLAPWALVLVALAFTRDSAWIPVLAACGLAVAQRSRFTAALAGTGLVAAVVPMLLVPVPMRELLAQMTNDAMPAPDDSWGDVLGRFPAAFVDLLQADGGFVRDGAWSTAAYLLFGMGLLIAAWVAGRRDETTTLMVAGTLAGALYVLAVPVFSAFRLELTLIPMTAFGLAIAATAALDRLGARDRPAAGLAGRRSSPLPRARWAGLGSSRR